MKILEWKTTITASKDLLGLSQGGFELAEESTDMKLDQEVRQSEEQRLKNGKMNNLFIEGNH